MPSQLNNIWTFIFIFIVAGNISGYWIKAILKKNGYPVKYFTQHTRDTKNIFKLAKSTEDKNKRLMYLALGVVDIVIGVTFIVAVLFSFILL